MVEDRFVGKQADLWVVVVDSSGGRLLHGAVSAQHRVRFEETSTIQNQHLPHEHGRPTMRRNSTLGHTLQAPGHEDEEMLMRFARDVTSWLQTSFDAARHGRVTVLAPARLVGALRKELPVALASHVATEVADLASVATTQLGDHPLIQRLASQSQSKS
jgi:protein required for attachment to host cells